jgi:penicillin amidase
MFCSVRFFQCTLPVQILAVAALVAAPAALAEDFDFPGLSDTVTVYEDALGIPTIKGSSYEDVVFVQGYLQARDRFFQMDFFRKTAAGRLAELVGSPALANDVQLRTLGLARAALASWQVYDAEMKGVLQAYANGVNAWLATNPLPPEYGVLELTDTDPWTPLDTIAYTKLLAFSLSFELDIDATVDALTYQGVGQVVGFNGAALFSEDTYRSQPTDGRVTLPGFLAGIGGIGRSGPGSAVHASKLRCHAQAGEERSGKVLQGAHAQGSDASSGA